MIECLCLAPPVYNDLPHPPADYLGKPPTADSHNEPPAAPRTVPNGSGATPTPLDGSVTATDVTLPNPSGQTEYAKINPWHYRSADGSNYVAHAPAMGQARTPYARSVSSKQVINPATLPDPNEIFERLLKRDKFEEHPGGISSMFFAFANLVIHSLFNSSHPSAPTASSDDYSNDEYTNLSSSYLDLSPLYGSSEAELKSVRRNDGGGRAIASVRGGSAARCVVVA